jgi:hypothetical protein
MSIEGKIGDISGGVEGKIGDISGDSTMSELTDFLLQDRDGDRRDCLELKVRRLQNEILGIARWLDARLRILEGSGGDLGDRVGVTESRLSAFDEINIGARLDALEHPRP